MISCVILMPGNLSQEGCQALNTAWASQAATVVQTASAILIRELTVRSLFQGIADKIFYFV
jgi:hypothetical protein